MPDYAAFLDAARLAVTDAATVCRTIQKNLDEVRAITKDDRSPVTIADYAAQAVVANILSEQLEGKLHLVGEESSGFLLQDEHAAHLGATIAAVREVWPAADEKSVIHAIDLGTGDTDHAGFWTLDPIDGTKGFLRGQQYCVSLAYVERGTPTVGLLACPNLPLDFSAPLDKADPVGSLYAAIRGAGSFEAALDDPDAELTRIVHTERAEGDPISVCESVEAAHSAQGVTQQILAKLGPSGEPARLDSQCKYAVVARGQADAYLRMPTRKGYVERIWDHAAGSLVATEAGCEVTDIHANHLDFSHGRGLEKNKGIICAPPRLHGQIIGAIALLQPEPDA